MSFFHYQQGDSALDDPVGYALGHQGAPYSSPAIQQIEGLSQNSFDFYQNNIRPTQQALSQFATDPNVIKQNVAQAESDVGTSYARLPAAFQQQMSGLGVVPTAAQTQAFSKTAALNKGVATAQAANAARATTAAQQSSALGV